MLKIKTLIVRAPGTNCDAETAYAFEQAGSMATLVHVNELITGVDRLANYHIMVIPGGFTYGDDISAGKVLANELKLKLGADIRAFVEAGKLVLGICNGFQVLVKAGVLSGSSDDGSPLLTVAGNDSGKFECRWVHLAVNQASPCIFTRDIGHLDLPVAHAEGKVVFNSGDLPGLNMALRYADESGNDSAGYPHNPNGSVGNVAGLCDDSGRIFGLMPHPERYIRGTQHPKWTRQPARERGDGFKIFTNAVKWARGI